MRLVLAAFVAFSCACPCLYETVEKERFEGELELPESSIYLCQSYLLSGLGGRGENRIRRGWFSRRQMVRNIRFYVHSIFLFCSCLGFVYFWCVRILASFTSHFEYLVFEGVHRRRHLVCAEVRPGGLVLPVPKTRHVRVFGLSRNLQRSRGDVAMNMLTCRLV